MKIIFFFFNQSKRSFSFLKEYFIFESFVQLLIGTLHTFLIFIIFFKIIEHDRDSKVSIFRETIAAKFTLIVKDIT